MNRPLLVLAAFVLVALPASAQTVYTRTANGNWSMDSGWNPVGVPGSGDTADLNGRTVTLDAAATVAVLIFPPGVNSVLGGAAALTVTDTLRWEAGQSSMTDTLTVGPQATFRVRGTANLRMGTGGVLLNRGRMVWEAPQRWNDVGQLVNEGEVEIPLDGASPINLCFSSQNPAITNAPGGLIRRTGPGTVYFSCGFNNDGTVRVEQGAFEYRGFNANGGTDTGAYEVAAGATLRFGGGVRTLTETASVTGAGTVEARVNGNTHSVSHAGTYDVTATRLLGPSSPRFDLNADATMPVLEITGGWLGGSGTVTVTDSLVWTAGRMLGSGTTIVQPDLALNAASVSLSDSRTLQLEGATTWSGEVGISNGSSDVTLINTGAFTSAGPGTRTFFAGTFRNEGTFVHDAGTVRFSSGFDNVGEVRIDGGTLALQGFNATGGTDSGTYAVAEGARLEFTGGNRTLAASAEVGGTGTVAFLGGSVTNEATWRPGASPGMLSIGSNYPAGSGLLEMELSGYAPGTEHDVLAVTGTATLDGSLRVALVDDFVPQAGDRFTVLTAGTVTGSFATLDLPGGVEASVETTDTTAVLVIGQVVANEDGGRVLPTAFALDAAYPNPFSAQATLRYDVPSPARVRLTLYDLLGREVAVLADGERAAGTHEARLDGRGLASGVYLVRMTTDGGVTRTRRVTLAR